MTLTNTMRAFIALEINDDAVKKKIEDIKGVFSRVEGKLKFVERENVHITLKFLGDITEETARDIYKVIQELDTIPAGGFDVAVHGLGTFDKRVFHQRGINWPDHLAGDSSLGIGFVRPVLFCESW